MMPNPFRYFLSLGRRVVSPFRAIYLPRETTLTEVHRESEYPWLEEQLKYFAGNVNRRFTPLTDNMTGETPEMRIAYRRAWAEPTVKAALLGKIGQVASLDLTCVPEDENNPLEAAIAEFCQSQLIGPSGTAYELAWSILSTGLMDGFSVCEKLYGVVERGKYRGKWTIRGLKTKDSRFLQFEVDPYRNITGIYSVMGNSGQLFDPKDFLTFTYMPFLNSPTGMSDMRAVYRCIETIVAALKLRLLYLDKLTGPYIKGKYRDPAVRKQLEEALRHARANGYITLQEGSDIEVLDLAMRGTSDFQLAIDDMRKEIAIGLTGAFLQMLEGSGPDVRGDSKVQKNMSEVMVWLLAVMLQSVINTQLIPDLVIPNFGDNAAWPKAQLGAVNPEEIIKDLGIDNMLLGMGLPLSKKDMYTRAGRKPPTDPGDSLVKAATPSPSPFGGGAFGNDNRPSTFAESPPAREVGQSAKGGDVALAGPDGKRMAELLSASIDRGAEVLNGIIGAAVKRNVDDRRILYVHNLFTPEETERLAESLASSMGTAELLGRARIRERAEKAEGSKGLPADEQPFTTFAEIKAFEPLSPERAVAYFSRLIPGLDIDPDRWGESLRRMAFSLAATTEQTVLGNVQRIIREQIELGTTSTASVGADIKDVLDAAGVTPKNPQYSEMVFRTNAMDAFVEGTEQERRDLAVSGMFPVWQYLGIRDGRQGADHEPHFDRYFPSSVPFRAVRGPRVYNCRCCPNPIDKYTWQAMQDAGQSVASFAEFADRSGLVRAEVTDKNGKKTHVWVSKEEAVNLQTTKPEDKPATSRAGGGKDKAITPEDTEAIAKAAAEDVAKTGDPAKSEGFVARTKAIATNLVQKVSGLAADIVVKFGIQAEDIFETAQEQASLFYASGKTVHDPISANLGVSPQVVAVVVSKVLPRVLAWARGKTGFAEGGDMSAMAQAVNSLIHAIGEATGQQIPALGYMDVVRLLQAKEAKRG